MNSANAIQSRLDKELVMREASNNIKVETSYCSKCQFNHYSNIGTTQCAKCGQAK